MAFFFMSLILGRRGGGEKSYFLQSPSICQFRTEKAHFKFIWVLGVLPTPLHAAAVNGNKSLLQRLLQEGKTLVVMPIHLLTLLRASKN